MSGSERASSLSAEGAQPVPRRRSRLARVYESAGWLSRLLFVVFYLEVGFALIVLPWSTFWDRNYFGQAMPVVRMFMTNDFVRGAVSGIGVVNIAVGIAELVVILLARREDPVSSLRPSVSEE